MGQSKKWRNTPKGVVMTLVKIRTLSSPWNGSERGTKWFQGRDDRKDRYLAFCIPRQPQEVAKRASISFSYLHKSCQIHRWGGTLSLEEEKSAQNGPRRFMSDLLQRATCLWTKRSMNTEKTPPTENPPSANTSSIIKKYLAPSDTWRATARKTRLTSSTSVSGCWKSCEGKAIQNIECPLSESCCMKAIFSVQGLGSKR